MLATCLASITCSDLFPLVCTQLLVTVALQSFMVVMSPVLGSDMQHA